MKELVKVELFECVRLEQAGESIDENRIHSGRLLSLLAYLIMYRDTRVQKKTLFKQVTGEEGYNPDGKLKNLIYRLRGMLKILGPEEYILTLPGGYQWNPDIPVVTDYERFEGLYRELSEEENPDRKRELCEAAAKCYRGNFSAGIGQEEWLIPRYIENQSRYVEIINQLGEMYKAVEKWDLVEKLYREAVVWEPYSEEFHSRLIGSLQRQGKFNQALEHYENTKKLFQENLGITPGILKSPFDPRQGGQPESLAELQERLSEPWPLKGTFFCDCREFREIYCLEARKSIRTGISEHLLLLTIRRTRGIQEGEDTQPDILRGMKILERVLEDCLRIGDVAANCGQTQFGVLLFMCSFEDGLMIAQRIRKRFQGEMKRLRLDLDLKYDLGEIVSPVEMKEVQVGTGA